MAALSEIEKLEARYAENPDGRYFAPLADAYRKAGQLDRALEVITAGLVKHPDYLSAHIVLARCHLDKKDDAAAQASFERVLSLDAENIIALKALADIAERGGRHDDARRWLMKLLAVDSMNSEAEEQLNRLGGPLVEEEAAVATEAAAAP
ncbi:MAG TPA: tetratricopeptide repeat protein, partial [Gemmatimonadales bacterium]|nr:tetratricopeptide repeat protein [Gemmatimonadales bacterium]